jgi:hypothetical protein
MNMTFIVSILSLQLLNEPKQCFLIFNLHEDTVGGHSLTWGGGGYMHPLLF